MKNYSEICFNRTDGPYTLFAVQASDGKKALLVVDYGGTDRTLSIALKGLPSSAVAEGTLLDHTHNLTRFAPAIEKGVLTLEKTDGNSAAWLIEFEGTTSKTRDR